MRSMRAKVGRVGLVLLIGAAMCLEGPALTISSAAEVLVSRHHLSVKFKGRNVPGDAGKYVSGMVASPNEVNLENDKYEVVLNSWTSELAQRCESGSITLHYHLIGPVYKNRRTGEIEHPKTQLSTAMLGAVAGVMANPKGSEERISFDRTDLSESERKIKVSSTLNIGMCASSFDSALTAACPISWLEQAEVECY